jgi:hypothetical protein
MRQETFFINPYSDPLIAIRVFRVAHIFIVLSLERDYRSRWNFEKMLLLTLKGLISYKVFPTNAIPFNLDAARATEKGHV